MEFGGLEKANDTADLIESAGHHVVRPAESSGGNVEQQIKTLQEQGRQAALKGDASFAEKYFADDYVGVGRHGQMRTKAEVIQMYRSGALKYEAIDERNVKVRTYGDAAIVNAGRTGVVWKATSFQLPFDLTHTKIARKSPLIGFPLSVSFTVASASQ